MCPIVIVEKVGQVPVFLQQVHSFGVDLVATKGYPSATQMYELAREIDD
ncbi:hypothetical protein [Prochlorococcus marinus]|nr:hypothetical protein [Prochlorococcus marinus]